MEDGSEVSKFCIAARKCSVTEQESATHQVD